LLLLLLSIQALGRRLVPSLLLIPVDVHEAKDRTKEAGA
jgi:hypothetical protein